MAVHAIFTDRLENRNSNIRQNPRILLVYRMESSRHNRENCRILPKAGFVLVSWQGVSGQRRRAGLFGEPLGAGKVLSLMPLV